MDALQQAGTTVCEPVLEVHLEFPADVLGPIMATLIDVGGDARVRRTSADACARSTARSAPRASTTCSPGCRTSPAAKACSSRRSAATARSPGEPPSRPRTDHNPLDRADYLRRLKGVTLREPERGRPKSR